MLNRPTWYLKNKKDKPCYWKQTYRGFSRQPCWRTETMKQFWMNILFLRGEKMYCFCPPTWRQWCHMKMLNRVFSRRPCWRAETMVLHENRSYFPGERKCIVFALQHGGNDVTWKCSIVFSVTCLSLLLLWLVNLPPAKWNDLNNQLQNIFMFWPTRI